MRAVLIICSVFVLGTWPSECASADNPDPIASFHGAVGSGAEFGWCLAAGLLASSDDMNMIVGAPLSEHISEPTTNHGLAVFFHGPLVPAPSSTQLRRSTLGIGDVFGYAAALSGHASYDTLDVYDVVVGAPGVSGSRGVVDFFEGSQISGSSVTPDATFQLANRVSGDRFGHSVASAGDFNGDGKADFIIGAPGAAATKVGQVGLFLGVDDPVSGTITESVLITGEDGYTGDSGGDSFGLSVAGGAELTGDSYDDVIIGAPHNDSGSLSNRGAVYVFAGSASPSSTIAAGSSTAEALIHGEAADDNFGTCVAIVGDLDGDGTSDVCIGSPGSNNTRGAVFVYRGGSSLSGTPTAAVKLVGALQFSIGNKIAGVGDVNSDGYDDFYVGEGEPTGTLSGEAQIVYGGDIFANTGTMIVAPVDSLSVDQFLSVDTAENFRMGQAGVALGDVDGDGLDDFAISSDKEVKQGNEPGAVYIWDSSLRLVDMTDGVGFNYGDYEPYAVVPINVDRSDINNDSGQDLMVSFNDSTQAQLWESAGLDDGQPVLTNQTTKYFTTENLPDDLTRGIAVADYDNDGELDMFIAHEDAPMLYHGTGATGLYRLENLASSKLSGADKSVAGSWGDYDRDGYLDLYVVRADGDLTYGGITGEQDKLFRSEEQQNSGFTDVTSTAGLTTSSMTSVAASWIDADEDGNLDLYVGELGSGGTGKFYLNDGDGTFTDATSAGSGPAVGGMSGVSGIAWADLNLDGDLDLIVSKMLGGPGAINLVTCGNVAGRFDAENDWLEGDLSEKMVGVMALDFDMNGYVDVLGIPSGDVSPPLHAGFDHSGEFYVERSTRAGLSAKAAGGVAVFDFDGDGDQEVFLGRKHSGQTATQDLFYLASRDVGSKPRYSWLGLRLIGATMGNNKEGVGALVKVRVPATGTAEHETIKQVGASVGRGGQDELITYFGFGAIDDDVKVTVVWPDGYSESKTYTPDHASEDLRLKGVRNFEEGDHNPGIRSGTFDHTVTIKPGVRRQANGTHRLIC